MNKVLEALFHAGLLRHLSQVEEVGPRKVMAQADAELLQRLRQDQRFVEGPLHRFHKVGEDPTEFRSHTDELYPGFKGSVQIVIDQATYRVEADIDKASPYSDLWSFVVHTGEVLGFVKHKDKEPELLGEVIVTEEDCQ